MTWRVVNVENLKEDPLRSHEAVLRGQRSILERERLSAILFRLYVEKNERKIKYA